MMWLRVIVTVLGTIALLGLGVLLMRIWQFYKKYRRAKKYKDELMKTMRGEMDLDECEIFGSDIDD